MAAMNTITLGEDDRLIGGVDFGEGPRWHDNKLWYSDFYQHTIYTVTADGQRLPIFSDLPDRPSGLGWTPDGTLMVVFMTTKQVMRDNRNGTLIQHADLSQLASGYCNDMVVDRHGNAYVGNFGFDLEANAKFAETDLILVRANGEIQVAASGQRFPNGSVITPDDSTLIVGQTFGGNYLAYDINDDATLSNQRVWAEIEGTSPDGCTLDLGGGIWMADAIGSQVLRVTEGGTITDRIVTPMPTYACALGGPDNDTLYILCAPGSRPDDVAGKAAGAIYQTRVRYPHAGRP